MGKNSRRRREPSSDRDVSGGEENGTYTSGTYSNSGAIVATSARRDGGSQSHVTDRANGGRSCQNRSSQPSNQPGIDHWSQAITETLQNIGDTQRALGDLQAKFKSHLGDIERVDETASELVSLQEEHEQRDEEIRKLKDTIDVLTGMGQETRDRASQIIEEVEKKTEDLDQERQKLVLDKVKLEKRVTAEVAEEKLRLKTDYEKLSNKYIETNDMRKKELEDEFARRTRDNDRTVAALEVKKKELSKEIEEQKKATQEKVTELVKAHDHSDTLQSAMAAVKGDKQKLQRELERVNEEFALDSKPEEHFKEMFANIYSSIESISHKYFHDLDGKDLEHIHNKLIEADESFSSVPIDDTDDSHDLRAAHGQRIISEALCQFIWKPLGSEYTILNPDLGELLGKLSDELEKSGRGGRTAKVWTALTMRALESLPIDASASTAASSKESLPGTGSVRTDLVIDKVFSVLLPLVSAAQTEDLRADLDALVTSAIEVWSSAQTGELKVIVSPVLDRSNREEWRSQVFDPPDAAEANCEEMSKTRHRIITLFPRVTIQVVTSPAHRSESIPGGFPTEPDEALWTIETCIHPGSGLPEWSPLVVRGQEDHETKKEEIARAIKAVYSSTKRNAGHGRKDSLGSQVSTPVGRTSAG